MNFVLKGKSAFALNIFYWMDGQGTLANAQTYNQNIKGLFAIYDIEKAMVVLNKMLKDGPYPTVITCNKLIVENLKQGCLNNAIRFLGIMKEIVVDPMTGIFQEMFECGKRPKQWNYTNPN